MKISKKQKEQHSRILDKIYSNGPISRIDISKELNITPATVSEMTGKLLETNYIHELGEDETNNKPGRKKILLDITPFRNYFIGVEYSEKFLAFCLSDNIGTIVKQDIIYYTNADFREKFTADHFLTQLTIFLDECRGYHPKAIGIALPGHYNSEKQSITTNNPFWQSFPLKDVIASVSLPLFFENNVKCMAIAERLFGKEKKNKNFIYLHVRRGMFSTYMYNGKIYADNKNLIGEIGHIVVNPNGKLCECGKRGCLQTYASEAWIVKKAKILCEENPHSYIPFLISDKSQLDIDTLIKAYKLGDEVAIALINEAIYYLSIAINNLFMMIDSDIIFFHGELFTEPEITNYLISCLEENSSLLNLKHPQQFIFKEYSEINGALGACGLCVSETI